LSRLVTTKTTRLSSPVVAVTTTPYKAFGSFGHVVVTVGCQRVRLVVAVVVVLRTTTDNQDDKENLGSVNPWSMPPNRAIPGARTRDLADLEPAQQIRSPSD